MNIFCKVFGHKWHTIERSNVIQHDVIGYPLRLFICKCERCKKTKQLWIDSVECKSDVILKWTTDDNLPIPPSAEREDKK